MQPNALMAMMEKLSSNIESLSASQAKFEAHMSQSQSKFEELEVMMTQDATTYVQNASLV